MQQKDIDNGGLASEKTLRDEYIGIFIGGMLSEYEHLEAMDVNSKEDVPAIVVPCFIKLATILADAAVAEKRRYEGRLCDTCHYGEWHKDKLCGCRHNEATAEKCSRPDFKLWEPKEDDRDED